MKSLKEIRRQLLGPTQKELRQEELQRRWNTYRAKINEVNEIWHGRRQAMDRALKTLEELGGGISDLGDFSSVVRALFSIGPDTFDNIMYVSYDVVDDPDGTRREYFYHEVEGTPLGGAAKDVAAVHVGWNQETKDISYVRLDLSPKVFGDIVYHYTLGFTDKHKDEVGLYLTRTDIFLDMAGGGIDFRKELSSKEIDEAMRLLRDCVRALDDSVNERRRGTRLK